MTESWLEPPPGAEWPRSAEPNPFVRYRRMLWSWHRAMDAGWTDEDFVDTVASIDRSIALRGHGFVDTPTAWNAALAGPGATHTVLAKDETGNVSGSHKARHLMGQLLHLAVDATEDDQRLAISSCGNAALGAATVARAANRPIDVFIPTWADPTIVSELDSLDADIHVCERRSAEVGDPCMLRFLEAVDAGAVPFGVQATQNLWTLDGGRTIGWELADQIGEVGGEVPDHLLVQVGGGALLISTTLGLLDGVAHSKLDSMPKVWAVQAEGCAPFDRAWRAVSDTGSVEQTIADAAASAAELMAPWNDPQSAATGILDDITYDWLGVLRALLVSGGGSVVASEDDILEANIRTTSAGFDADPTGSAGYAGLLAAVSQGVVDADDSAAVLITGIRR